MEGEDLVPLFWRIQYLAGNVLVIPSDKDLRGIRRVAKNFTLRSFYELVAPDIVKDLCVLRNVRAIPERCMETSAYRYLSRKGDPMELLLADLEMEVGRCLSEGIGGFKFLVRPASHIIPRVPRPANTEPFDLPLEKERKEEERQKEEGEKKEDLHACWMGPNPSYDMFWAEGTDSSYARGAESNQHSETSNSSTNPGESNSSGRHGRKGVYSNGRRLRELQNGKCHHGKRSGKCRDCGGSAYCMHGKQKYSCRECGGAGICSHGQRKYLCKACGGSAICKHGKVKYSCPACKEMKAKQSEENRRKEMPKFTYILPKHTQILFGGKEGGVGLGPINYTPMTASAPQTSPLAATGSPTNLKVGRAV